jgi:hypothetical protein
LVAVLMMCNFRLKRMPECYLFKSSFGKLLSMSEFAVSVQLSAKSDQVMK